MLNETDCKDIIEICISIDEKAMGLYQTLYDCEQNDDLRKIWGHMADDELEHIKHWKSLLKYSNDGRIPTLFKDPLKLDKKIDPRKLTCGSKINNEEKLVAEQM